MSIPDWLLERYVLGEVTDAERRTIEADPALDQRVAALIASNDAIRRAYSAAEVGRRARAEAARRRAGTDRRWMAVPLLVAVAAAGLLVLRTPDDGHRGKGHATAELRVYRQAEAGPQPLPWGARAEAGDVLQIEYAGATADHGWVVSVDGRGTVTLHNRGRLHKGVVALPEAYRLDDAPAFEHFFLVVADRPVPEAEVKAAVGLARDRATLDVADAVEVDLLVRKP